MSYPANLKYTKEHEWFLSKDSSSALIGVTSYAVEQLGDIVHVELPKVGEEFGAGDPFGTIESTKTVSDLYIPVAGKVLEVNTDIKNMLDELVNDPYSKGWLVKVSVKNPAEVNGLMSAAQYESFISEQGG